MKMKKIKPRNIVFLKARAMPGSGAHKNKKKRKEKHKKSWDAELASHDFFYGF
jgi:hypothetical protein